MTNPAYGPDVATQNSNTLPAVPHPILRADQVVVAYGGVHAVSGVSLSVASGEVLGIIGPNGAGKSSLLAALGGQVRHASGSIQLGDREVGRLMPHQRARLGLARTFQTTSEFSKMTVFENLITAAEGNVGSSLRAVVLQPHRTAQREAELTAQAWAVLRRFEMTHVANVYGGELSGGQRRLVEIMRCLMRRPKVLLLDEPMVGVAPHLTGKLIADLRSISEDGLAVVIVEHAMDVVRQLCSRVIVMAFGQIIAMGTFAEVVQDATVQSAYLS